MKVLFLNPNASAETVTTQQLARIAPQLQFAVAAAAEEAVSEIRKGGWHGLMTAPSIGEADTLTLVARLRQDRVPIAIVPVVTVWRQEFFSAAVAAGADDVLLVRGDTAVHVGETLSRIKQSPHLMPSEERRFRVLFVGKDTLVWNLLEQVPFVRAERTTSVADGALAGRTPVAGRDALGADAIVIDDQPGDSPTLPVVKFARAHAPDLPIVVLAAASAGESGAGVLDLGVDDCIPKTGIYRRRLIASLNRLHQRHELVVQHTAIKAREARLRQIVENLPEGLAVISSDGTVLAMNATSLPLVGATRPADVVGREFSSLVAAEHRDEARAFVARVSAGEAASVTVDLEPMDRVRRTVEISGVMLERDARGARGVVAVIRPPRVTAGAPDAEQIQLRAKAIAADAADRASAASADLQRATDGHRKERAAWDAARAQLEERLQQLLTDADARHGLDMRLAVAESDLRDATAAKQRADADRQAGCVEAREATESRRQLEATLRTAQAELERSAGAVARLSDDIDRLRSEAGESADRHTAEQSAWADEREALQARIRDVEVSAERHATQAAELDSHSAALRAAIDERDDVSLRLQAARDELRSAVEAQLAAQAAWDRERQTLETRVGELPGHQAARSALERDLAAAADAQRTIQHDLDAARRAHEDAKQEIEWVRDELSAARAAALSDVTAFERERDAARAERDGLEADREATRRERDGLRADLERAQLEARRTADEHLAERAGWDASRFHFESRLSEAQTSAISRVELESRLDAARADLQQAADTLNAERAGWEATRRQLESRLHETQAIAGARGDLEAQLDAARNELRSHAESSTRDRMSWDAVRRTLEHQLESAQDQIEKDREAWQSARAEFEAHLANASTAETERQRLDHALRALEAQHGEHLAALVVDRATRQREQAELEALRRAVDEERAQRIKLDDELVAVRAEADGHVLALEIEYTAGRRALEARIDDTESRLALVTSEAEAAERQRDSHASAVAAGRDRLARSHLFGYALTSLDGRLLRCNETFAQLFGYRDVRDALSRTAGVAFPALAGRDVLDAQLALERQISHFESCLERVDGTPINVVESAAIVKAPAGLDGVADEDVVERVVVDMSGSLALESRLRQAQRLEEVGTLATAMAPDITALLTSIDEIGAQVAGDLREGDPQHVRAGKIRARAARAADLMRQLLAFSRRQVQAPAPVDLNDAVNRAEPVLTRLIGAHVDFDIRLGKADGVAAGEDDLEQLLTTLVVSGRDLLPVGGSLVLETKRLDFDPGARDADTRMGLGVVLSVTASGYGVQPVQQALAVELIARRCGGDLRMSGEPGRRAVLEVYFSRFVAAPARVGARNGFEQDDVPADYWSWTPD